ncbi:MAG: hypothetical protein WBX01_07615 [Nitrososphaeraceae archaeon]
MSCNYATSRKGVDFQNTAEEIVKAFEPFYQGITLIDKTDPGYLFRLYNLVMKYKIIADYDLNEFATYLPRRNIDNASL